MTFFVRLSCEDVGPAKDKRLYPLLAQKTDVPWYQLVIPEF
jgi:hypothetical protein